MSCDDFNATTGDIENLHDDLFLVQSYTPATGCNRLIAIKTYLKLYITVF